jgi:Ca2+-binding RTX toxin-like protein
LPTVAREIISSTRVYWLAAVVSASIFLFFVSAPAYGDPVIAAAGDIACDTNSEFFNGGVGMEGHCRQLKTSDLLLNAGLSAVLALGDNQYHNGSLSDFNASFDPSWGRLKPIIRPIPGNHEYSTDDARGYFDYFNGVGSRTGAAGDRHKGYYSFDIGNWHLIALNAACTELAKGAAANGCAAGSPQERWLRSDLASRRTSCTLAYFHEPRFNSGFRGNSPDSQAFWETLYSAGADLVLSGDAHDYERFAPQAPDGTLDTVRGIRQFVVGTGGAFFTGWSTRKPNSEVRQNRTFGVLAITLRPTSYEWQFLPEAGKTFTDSGSGVCHGRTSGFGPDANAPVPKDPVRGPCTIQGTDRNDRLVGTSKRDVICGLGGNDSIWGLGGNDLIRGGTGRDRLYGGKGRDRLYGSAGNDRLHGGSGGDRLVSGGGRDRLYGNRGRDSLSSRDKHGRDRVLGGRGRDSAKVDKRDHVRSVERVSFK